MWNIIASIPEWVYVLLGFIFVCFLYVVFNASPGEMFHLTRGGLFLPHEEKNDKQENDEKEKDTNE